ncbi:hypothetical protein PoB_003131400 [Plakobranchus ocellatus]|uniref:Uncharacterized protein n=1 Tax=Plakobranchus ocellatus TaxID=259542 RepID=A0AAV4AEE6_9GAST|nr:hypothetical protein PoB_003131400 [Plakobranchus ocellatus]
MASRLRSPDSGIGSAGTIPESAESAFQFFTQDKPDQCSLRDLQTPVSLSRGLSPTLMVSEELSYLETLIAFGTNYCFSNTRDSTDSREYEIYNRENSSVGCSGLTRSISKIQQVRRSLEDFCSSNHNADLDVSKIYIKPLPSTIDQITHPSGYNQSSIGVSRLDNSVSLSNLGNMDQPQDFKPSFLYDVASLPQRSVKREDNCKSQSQYSSRPNNHIQYSYSNSRARLLGTSNDRVTDTFIPTILELNSMTSTSVTDPERLSLSNAKIQSNGDPDKFFEPNYDYVNPERRDLSMTGLSRPQELPVDLGARRRSVRSSWEQCDLDLGVSERLDLELERLEVMVDCLQRMEDQLLDLNGFTEDSGEISLHGQDAGSDLDFDADDGDADLKNKPLRWPVPKNAICRNPFVAGSSPATGALAWRRG